LRIIPTNERSFQRMNAARRSMTIFVGDRT
jgi:hypothetical protein